MKSSLCLLALLCGVGAHAQHYVCKTGQGSYYQSPFPCSEQPGAVRDWQQETHLEAVQGNVQGDAPRPAATVPWQKAPVTVTPATPFSKFAPSASRQPVVSQPSPDGAAGKTASAQPVSKRDASGESQGRSRAEQNPKKKLQDTGQARREKLQPQTGNKEAACAQLRGSITTGEKVARYGSGNVGGDDAFYAAGLRADRDRYFRLRCGR